MKPADGVMFPGGAVQCPVSGQRGGRTFSAHDWLAEEVPVALEFNGVAHAVMLATPLDLEDFALGFSLSEGILSHPGQLYDLERHDGDEGITLRMQIASAAFHGLKDRRRTLAGRTGCGLCGTERLSQVQRPMLPLAVEPQRFALAAVARAMGVLRALQALQQATGAVHAAAWCDADGAVRLLREDVGRHNALDKLIGALARAPIDAAAGFVAVTSRASFEMVQKTVCAGMPLLAAVSAATALAVQTADRSGLTLVGFARGDDHVVYTHSRRLYG
jgi:FdhD protein